MVMTVDDDDGDDDRDDDRDDDEIWWWWWRRWWQMMVMMMMITDDDNNNDQLYDVDVQAQFINDFISLFLRDNLPFIKCTLNKDRKHASIIVQDRV